MGISQSSLLYRDLPVVIVCGILGLLFLIGIAYACLFHPKHVGAKKDTKGKSGEH